MRTGLEMKTAQVDVAIIGAGKPGFAAYRTLGGENCLPPHGIKRTDQMWLPERPEVECPVYGCSTAFLRADRSARYTAGSSNLIVAEAERDGNFTNSPSTLSGSVYPHPAAGPYNKKD